MTIALWPPQFLYGLDWERIRPGVFRRRGMNHDTAFFKYDPRLAGTISCSEWDVQENIELFLHI